MVRVAVLRCSQVMRDRLFGDDQAGGNAKRSFAYKLMPWESSRWHVGVFLSESEAELKVVGLGLVHRGRRFATYERNIDVEDVTATTKQIPLNQLGSRLGQFADAVTGEGPITEARGRRLLAALIAESSDLEPVISQLTRRISDDVTGGVAGELQGLQKDATGVLLMARNMDRDELRQYVPQPAGTPFIAGLPETSANDIESPQISHAMQIAMSEESIRPKSGKVTEDQLINHDADRVPFRNWFQMHDHRVGWRTFVDGSKRMEIFNANRTDAEHEMGVDLIYYSVNHRSFVMVQYKRMRMESELVYRPDKNLAGELERMRYVDQECSKHDINSDEDARLLATPCMVKLCAPQTVVQDSVELITGMYLGREHFENLLSSPRCLGPKGGVQMSFTNVPRHLNNTTFAELLGAGWIGSRGRGSDYVGQQIRKSLEAGRSVVAGFDLTPQTTKRRRPRSTR